MLGSAKKAADDAATPHRNISSMQQTLSNALHDATTPQNIEDAEIQSPKMKVDTLKLLGESVKLNAQTGPVAAFLRSIILHQPAAITAHFETMDINKKHAIYDAIENLQIRTFRKLLTETFDLAFPREERIHRFIRSIQETKFDEYTQDLLELRKMLISAVLKMNQVAELPKYSAENSYAMLEIMRHFKNLIDQIQDYSMKIEIATAMAKIETMDVQKLQAILLTVDSKLRARTQGSYLPKPPSIPVHVARPDTAQQDSAVSNKPICPACKARWGFKWHHFLSDCFLHPSKRESKTTWMKKWDDKWAVDNPGKEMGTYQWKEDKRRRTTPDPESPLAKRSKERPM